MYLVHIPRSALNDPSRLTALDTGTGEVRWQRALPHGAASAPAVADGTVYIGTGAGRLRAFDAAAGAVDHSPAVSDGVVYFGDRSGGAYAVDVSTGHERWHLPDGFGAGGFAISGSSGWVTIGRWHRDLYRVDLADGRPEWRCSLDAAVSDPVIADGVLYVTKEKGKVLALDALTGRKPSFRGRRSRP